MNIKKRIVLKTGDANKKKHFVVECKVCGTDLNEDNNHKSKVDICTMCLENGAKNKNYKWITDNRYLITE